MKLFGRKSTKEAGVAAASLPEVSNHRHRQEQGSAPRAVPCQWPQIEETSGLTEWPTEVAYRAGEEESLGAELDRSALAFAAGCGGEIVGRSADVIAERLQVRDGLGRSVTLFSRTYYCRRPKRNRPHV